MIWWTPVHVGEITAVATTLATIFMATFTFFLYRSTNKLWEAGKDSLEQTERAFVFLDGINCVLPTAADSNTAVAHLPEQYRDDPGLFVTRFAIQPRWKNGGNTPTRNMTINVRFQRVTDHMRPDYLYQDLAESFFIAPKAIEPSVFIEIPTGDAQAIIEHDLDPIGVPSTLLIWGRAYYEDVFGHAHSTEWCRQVRFGRSDILGAVFIQWGDYNRSD